MNRQEEILYLEEYQKELQSVGNDLSYQAKARLKKLRKVKNVFNRGTTEAVTD